jgi:hypothetical protein
MAIPALTESELREAIAALDSFKAAGLKSSRFDPELDSGKSISFQKNDGDNEWVMK